MTKTSLRLPVQIRTMQASDIATVFALEHEQYSTWSPAMLAGCLQPGYYNSVLEVHQEILGFMLVAAHSDEWELLKFAVKTEQRRHGYGYSLLTHLITTAQQQSAKKIHLEVRASNYAAIALYQRCNFQLIGKRALYYQTLTGREDALVWVRLL